MRSADIFFVTHHDHWVSKTIAWVMNSEWGHSGLIYEVTPKTVYTFETTSYEVTPQFFSDYENDPNISFEVWSPTNMTDETREIICKEAKKLNEMQYAYGQLFSLGIRALLRKFNIFIKNFIKKNVVCCHVITTGYVLSKISEFENIDPRSIDTEELHKIVSLSNKFKLIRKTTYGKEIIWHTL